MAETHKILDLTQSGAFGRSIAIDTEAIGRAPFAPQNEDLYSYLPTVPHEIDPHAFLRDMFAKQPRAMTIAIFANPVSFVDTELSIPFPDEPEKLDNMFELYGQAHNLGSTCVSKTVANAVRKVDRPKDREAIRSNAVRAIRREKQLTLGAFAMYETAPDEYEGILAVSNVVVEASQQVLARRGIAYTPDMYWPLATRFMYPLQTLKSAITMAQKAKKVRPEDL